MHLRMIYTRLCEIDGGEVTIGGIQTYLQSLAQCATNIGLIPVVYQCATVPFQKQLGALRVKGVMTDGLGPRRWRQRLYESARTDMAGNRDILLFGTDTLSVPTDYPRAVAVQHGISWDVPAGNHGRFCSLDKFRAVKTLRMARRHAVFRRYFENCRNRVCVDYNFQNWYRTFHPDLTGTRTWIIPNFSPIPDAAKVQDKLSGDAGGVVRILFARRFEAYRGTRLMGEVVSRLLGESSSVFFTFAGDGPDKEWLAQRFAGESRVAIRQVPFEQRMALTLEHDIAVVPTLGSEGTSLSLAEAMASGCAVVATDVGGMTNMVLDGYNGRLVAPTVEAVYQALCSLIRDAERRIALARRAREVAIQSFSEEVWHRRWTDVLEELASS